MYNAYITTLTNVRAHPNADKLQLADCFGNTICVPLDYAEGMKGVYFPVDGQLSEEFAEKNNLVRKKDDAGNSVGGYLDPAKRNIQAIRLRGEKSDGLFLPCSAFNYCFEDGDAEKHMEVGTPFTVLNGHFICQKYIPRTNPSRSRGTFGGNKPRKHKVPVAPLFAEHVDTEQLAYNLSAFKPSDEIEITLKMHGTSQRTGYLPVLQGYADSYPRKVANAFRTLMNKMAGKTVYELKHDGEPIYDWGYVSGTRRTVLEDYEGGYYGDNHFREQHSKWFEGKLQKGESVYYEVVGFTDNGTPIMGNGDNRKLNDKAFIQQYGETTVFSYGCEPNPVVHEGYNDSTYGYQNEHVEYKAPQSDIYVYRMTFTNEDGFVVEYTPDFMRYRCEQMGVKCVPVFAKAILPSEEYFENNESVGEYVKVMAEQYYDGPDPIGKTHVREGVVVRILNRPKFCAYKHKNFSFKVIEGIVKASAEAPDMEEAQEVSEDTI